MRIPIKKFNSFKQNKKRINLQAIKISLFGKILKSFKELLLEMMRIFVSFFTQLSPELTLFDVFDVHFDTNLNKFFF